MRQSDRYITPAVIVAGIFAATVMVLAVTAGVVWLQSQGRDPAPILDLVAKLVTALGALGTLALQLAGRATQAKTERNVGVELPAVRAELANVRAGQHHMAEALWDVADALPRPVPRTPADDPPPEAPRAFAAAHPPTVEREAAPAPQGSC